MSQNKSAPRVAVRCARYILPYAGCHLQRTGETMLSSFFIASIALSTVFRSSPVSSAIFPAFSGTPASRIAFRICSFSSIVFPLQLPQNPVLCADAVNQLKQWRKAAFHNPRDVVGQDGLFRGEPVEDEPHRAVAVDSDCIVEFSRERLCAE